MNYAKAQLIAMMLGVSVVSMPAAHAKDAYADRPAKDARADKPTKEGKADKPTKEARQIDLRPRDTRSEAQRTFDRNYENAKVVSERKQKEATQEQLRDKSHDGRVMVGKDTSVGVGNIKKSIP